VGYFLVSLRVSVAVSREVYVRGWVKALMYGATLAPAIVAIVGLMKQSFVATETRGLEFCIGTAMIAASCWLFGRLYFLCSVIVTEAGIEQSSLSLRKGLKRKVRLGWERVVSASFRASSFHFLGDEGTKLELNTTLFNNAQETIRAVHNLLPDRLRSQAGF